MIGLEKTQESERIDPKGRGARRNCCTVELVDTEGALRLKRSHSFSEDSWTEEHERVESHNDRKKNIGSMSDDNKQLAKRNTILLARRYDADRK